MININQSIANIKKDIAITKGLGRDGLIEVIMHEGAGRDRKTLLVWLNEQVELLPAEVDPVPEGEIGDGNELNPGAPLKIATTESAGVSVTPPSVELGVRVPRTFEKVKADSENAKPTEFVPFDALKPIYRPERRGGVWCVLDVASGKMRQETFEVKGDARAFIADLELYGNQIKEKLVHFLGSE